MSMRRILAGFKVIDPLTGEARTFRTAAEAARWKRYVDIKNAIIVSQEVKRRNKSGGG